MTDDQDIDFAAPVAPAVPAEPVAQINSGSLVWHIPSPDYSLPKQYLTGVHLLYPEPQPAAAPQPFTQAQVRRLWDNSPEIQCGATSRAAFARIVSLVEAAHGISAAREPKA